MRRKTLLLTIVAVAILTGVAWWKSAPTDPVVPAAGPEVISFEGGRLSDWAYLYEVNAPVPRLLTREDLQATGPGALRWLIYQMEQSGPAPSEEELARSNSPDRRRLRELGWKWLHLRLHDKIDECAAAAKILQVMGPDALPAVPALLRALNTTDDNRHNAVRDALNGAGTRAWPMILQALADGSKGTRVNLAADLPEERWKGDGLTDAEYDGLINALARATGDPDPDIRLAAAHGVGECINGHKYHPAVEPAVTALIALLDDPDARRRGGAAQSFCYFRIHAPAALPRLIELISDPDDQISMNAAIAVRLYERKNERALTRFRRELTKPNSSWHDYVRGCLRDVDELPAD